MVFVSCQAEEKAQILDWLSAKDKELFSSVSHTEDWEENQEHEEGEEEEEEELEFADDLSFVITGKLKLFENREAFADYIEEYGGTVLSDVSSKTDYLICNDPSSASSKMKKAKELGVPVISERDFVRRFGCSDDFDDWDDACETGKGIFTCELTESGISTDCGGEYGFYYSNLKKPICALLQDYYCALKETFPGIGLTGELTVVDKYSTDRFGVSASPDATGVRFTRLYYCEACWDSVEDPYYICGDPDEYECICSPNCAAGIVTKQALNWKYYLNRMDHEAFRRKFYSDLPFFMEAVVTCKNVDGLLEAVPDDMCEVRALLLDWKQKVSDSISKKTDFLVCNEADATSSKAKKAAELGIPVITEGDFIGRFGFPDDFDEDDDEDE